MGLFEPRSSRESEEFLGTDAATRALSVTAVENDFVARVYENIAWAYDLIFGFLDQAVQDTSIQLDVFAYDLNEPEHVNRNVCCKAVH